MKRALALTIALLALSIGAKAAPTTPAGQWDVTIGHEYIRAETGARGVVPPIDLLPLTRTILAMPQAVDATFVYDVNGPDMALAAAIPPAATCTAPCVSLSWTASPTTGAQYNILRGTTAGGESATPINATPLAAGTTSYNDTTVIGGTTYFYAAVAVCVTGGGCPAGVVGTSARSNEVSIAEPTSVPLPPANLTGVAQ